MTQEEARERMIQRGETQQQTEARHFRASQEELKGQQDTRAAVRHKSGRGYADTLTDERAKNLIRAVRNDVQRVQRNDGRSHGKTAAERARESMIAKMEKGGSV